MMKKIINLLLVILLMCSCAGKREEENAADRFSKEPDTSEKTNYSESEERTKLNKLWDENYAVNDDYVGEITVGDLFTCPFVQGRTNDTYLRRNWQTMEYDEEGSIFMDCRNTVDDQNLIIYGHYVYASYDASGTHKFTPLRLLTEEDNYEANRYITMHLKDEIRTYEIAMVLYVDTCLAEDGLRYSTPELPYDQTAYDGDRLAEYIANARARAFYDTGVEIDRNDRLLTLQTCVEGREDLREIVIARLINTANIR